MSDQEEEEQELEGEEEEDVGAEEGTEDDEEKIDDEEVEEEEEKIPDNPLSEEIIADNSISLLSKTGDGLAHAFVRLDIHDREITSVEVLRSYIHLRYVDMSRNYIKDLSALNSLTNLLTLKADQNKLTNVSLEPMPYLQVAVFNVNKIKTTEGLNHPLIEQLSLCHNLIKQVTNLDPAILTRLHTIELRGNKLETTAGFNLPNLKNLFLAGNLIKKIEGLEKLERLATLHLRDNQLENLDGFTEDQKTLQYINLRGNQISDGLQIGNLAVLPMLSAVVLSENPVTEEDDYRLEALILLRRIERLDKDQVEEPERRDAEDMYEQRRQEKLAAEGQEMIEDGEEDVGAEE